MSGGLLSLAPEFILEEKWTTMVDESTLNLIGNSTRHYSNTLHCRAQGHLQCSQLSTTSLVVSAVHSRLFDIKIASW